jgi:hypothetical protein
MNTATGTTTATSTDSKVQAQVVEDEPIPPMYLPGKIVHIYSYRGTYRAAIVPCDHASLRRIEVRALHTYESPLLYEGSICKSGISALCLASATCSVTARHSRIVRSCYMASYS